MEGFHVNEFCHKIERKSLNPTTVYFNNSAESQELFNNDHHPVKWHKWHIANTTISMINTTIWDIVISTTHRNITSLWDKSPINTCQPWLDSTSTRLWYIASRMRAWYMFSSKSYQPQNESPSPPKKPFTYRKSKTKFRKLEVFLSTFENNFF